MVVFHDNPLLALDLAQIKVTMPVNTCCTYFFKVGS